MKEFKKLNNILGWVVFAIASTVYLLTTEPTGSLWDCGEYISTAYKLQVGHPPGAPLFQLLGRFFSMFAPDPSYVAQMVNAMSALASSFTILFLFWTITHMARKLVAKDGVLEGGNLIAVLGAGAVGALAYTFTDSFWFSAVEGEVYALSSFFTAIVFWAILKWEEAADQGHAFRWIILIAYLMGLSIGVHLLNLLAIPAITFVYYFKKYKPSTKGIIITFVISIVLLALVMYVIIPWMVLIAGLLERFFVNSIGLPFHTGSIVFFLLLVGGIVFGLFYTQKKKKLVGNTILLAFTFITIGYMSFLILVVRSNANTPIDENNPEDATSLLAYLNREQYGDWPLFYGQYYNAPTIDAEDNSPVYTKSYAIVEEDKLPHPSKITLGDRGLVKIFQYKEDAEKELSTLKKENPNLTVKQAYVITDERKDRIPVYDPDFTTIFPRMWSSQRSIHPIVYDEYITDRSNKKTVRKQDGSSETLVIPSFGDNLRFFFKYQIGHMYMRYFMWNFAGRQNDIQGHGNNLHGNWISGIKFLDEARLGPQSELPVELQDNKATNKYFMLPLILGLLGLWFHFSKNYKDGIVVAVLFLMTGLAIVVYLNQYPYQPRERDYAYVASFYAFAIWIGLGVMALYDILRKYTNPKVVAIAVTSATFLLVPVIMAQQNWDDHDRSGRYNALNIAKNYLNSCEQNAILFTNGDNDTFPLWYAQEVEGIRTDVKVVNLSLFNTDWYIDQMLRKTYDADPIPFNIGRDKYIQGTNDVAYFIKNPNIAKEGVHYNVKDLVDFFFSEDSRTKFQPRGADPINYFPTSLFYIPVDKSKVLANGTVAEKDSAQIIDKVEWRVKGRMIQKNDLMMIQMLASFDWDRPVYYAITTGPDSYLNLMEYFQLDGMAYRLVPIQTKNNDMLGTYGRVNTDVLYDNLMNKFRYDGLNNPDLYFDQFHMHSIRNYRSNFAKLAKTLAEEGKNEKAKEVLDRAFEVLPEKTISYDVFVTSLAETYYKIGEKERAEKITTRLIDIQEHDLLYYYNPDQKTGSNINEKRTAMMILQRVSMATQAYDEELAKRANDIFMQYYQRFSMEAPN
jgi:tetratricopeptide (TPR) repeat protein/MFS family permease